MDFLIQSSSLNSIQQSNQSIRIQSLKTAQRSNSYHFRDINFIIQESDKTYTRRKSCHCSECGSLGKFQYENMNMKLLFGNNHKREFDKSKSSLTLTLPKQEIFFPRRRTVRKTNKKTTIIDSNTTCDKIDEQRTQYFNSNIQQRSSILSNIIRKRESSIQQVVNIKRPSNLNKQEQKNSCYIPTNQMNIQTLFPVQLCCGRIKRENYSDYNQILSKSDKKDNKSNYKNSPYYYTYRSILIPKIKVRINEQKK